MTEGNCSASGGPASLSVLLSALSLSAAYSLPATWFILEIKSQAGLSAGAAASMIPGYNVFQDAALEV